MVSLVYRKARKCSDRIQRMFANVSVPKTIKEGGGEGRWCTLSFSNSLSLTEDRIFGKKKSTHCHE